MVAAVVGVEAIPKRFKQGLSRGVILERASARFEDKIRNCVGILQNWPIFCLTEAQLLDKNTPLVS